MEWPRWPLLLGFVSLAAIGFVAAALLAGPELVDLPSVKSGLEHKLSQAAKGHIAWDGLRIRLVPIPRVEMRGVTIDIPDLAHASIEQAQARLRLRPLLRGQIEFASIAIVRPSIRVDIPSSAPAQDETAFDPVAAYRSLIGPLAQALQNAAPGAIFEISDADVVLRGTPAPELRLRGLALRVGSDSTGFHVEGSAAGNLWDRLKLAGRVEFADLSGNFDLDLTGLNAQAWLDDWFSGGWLRMDIPRADLKLRVVTDARSELRCDLGIDAASLRIAHAEHGMPVSRSHLKATAALRPQEIEVALSQLQIGSLIPAGRGTLHMTSDGEKPRLEVDLPTLDVGAVRDFVMALVAPDSPSVRRHAARALGGAITHLKMRSEGDTWHALIRIDHLDGSTMLEHASLLLPVIEQEARDLRGRVTLTHANIELAAVSAQLGPSRLSDAGLRYSMRDGAVSASIGFELDLPQALTTARHVLRQNQMSGLDDIESAAGRLQGRAEFASADQDWNASVDVTRSDARFRVRSVPWPVSLEAVRTSISSGQVSISGLHVMVGSSTFSDIGASLALRPEPRLTGGSGRATLVLDEIYPWLRSQSAGPKLLGDIDSVSGSVQINLNRVSGSLAQPSALAFDAIVQPSQLSVAIKGLPGPLAIAGGVVHVDPDALRLDGVHVAMLDARGLVSGEMVDYRGTGTQMRANIADAVVGQQCAHWIWQRTGAPAQFEPRAPLRFAVERASWGANRAVDAVGSVTFESGPELTVDLSWQPDTLDVRRLVIRDRNNEATFSLRARADLLEAKFSGSIAAQSIAAMFKGAGEFQGQATGDLRLTLDLERRGRTSAQGWITAQALDLDELLPAALRAQARIDRLDLSADGSSLQIHEAAVSWAQQVATISGRVAREGKGVFVDVELDSPGIQVDALLHRGGATAELKAVSAEAKSADTDRAAFFSWMHALSVTGRVRLHSNFVEFERYRLAPMTATIALADGQAELRLQDTQLCGLSIPMTVQITPQGLTASAQILAHQQQLEQVARCLTDQRLLLTGEFDASANLTAKGSPDVLLTNLEGTVHLESRNGVVRKFALVGNILTMTDVATAFNRSRLDLLADGFPYRTLDIDGHFTRGRFIVEDFTFDSSAFGLAATGSVGLAQRDTQLTVLVAPFGGFTNLVRKVPIFGALVGRTLTSVPVAVRGDIRDPTVVPFDPRAIASDLTALFSRALKIPERMLAPSGSNPPSAAPSSGP